MPCVCLTVISSAQCTLENFVVYGVQSCHALKMQANFGFTENFINVYHMVTGRKSNLIFSAIKIPYTV